MANKFEKLIDADNNSFYNYFNLVSENEKKLMVQGDLYEVLKNYTNGKNEIESLRKIVELIQETVTLDHSVYINVRESIGKSEFYLCNLEEKFTEKIKTKHYLFAKEIAINPESPNNFLTLNFEPFYKKNPSVRDTKSIGHGVQYLNKFLSSQMFTDVEKWKQLLFNFIRLHKYDTEQLLLNDRITDPEHLNEHIDIALEKLKEYDKKEPYQNFKHTLQDLGFESGLGKDAETYSASLKLLDNLLNSPDHISLKEFISRIPMIFRICIISIHGYFAQEGVLGLPDTGGQVVYILDQVKALEKSLNESLKESGLNIKPKIIILTRQIKNAGNTKCNVRLEKVHQTKNSWILRVPFREHNPKVTDNWISRFEIYPYLEEFVEDASIELLAEFGGRPDLIIGNYSDGNLASYLLSKKFGVTQCCIAHALEKSKYLFSGLYWNQLEEYYNFSLQFTADLIAINSTDFLITSTFQEIAGTDNSIGQYESYQHFTMPGLYRVENGANLKHTKFNIVSPGVNENIYFPYTNSKKRLKSIQKSIREMLFENKEDPEIIGKLDNPDLIPIFSMARLDKIKNLTALVRWFGESTELQEKANLIIVAGKVNAEDTTDNEEKEQIGIMHDLINKYELHGKIRWLGKLFRKDEAGEVYRIIADHHGVFVQPALFEGFGLTVLEAMISGLPVFATKYGGPLEIIQNGENGFHIDPVDQKNSTDKILRFIKKVAEDENHWNEISTNGINRVNEAYNWKLYTKNLLSQAKIYGFWKFATNMENEDMAAYLDIIYHMLYKPRAQKLLEKHYQRD
ncbi:MAG: sucrose synthase [Melioribacteraceae bacterium]|nr:sucrose synthase [Melioribacteraceae bacterium]MCF8354724.1 sucrose synthase [Melioribacteraceae bacterium]MCF8394353.1 sucrose synthase [Melioribacteraceae bacterium]MCF8420063.1 sucrose synthase [Melioribacteraceae bacterium]